MLNWFAENTDCPVNGCNCKCDSIDNLSDDTDSSEDEKDPDRDPNVKVQDKLDALKVE